MHSSESKASENSSEKANLSKLELIVLRPSEMIVPKWQEALVAWRDKNELGKFGIKDQPTRVEVASRTDASEELGLFQLYMLLSVSDCQIRSRQRGRQSHETDLRQAQRYADLLDSSCCPFSDNHRKVREDMWPHSTRSSSKTSPTSGIISSSKQ